VRERIDVTLAAEQHRAYEGTLAALGSTVEHLPPAPELPDSVFVEDTAVVLPEIAIITRPGAESRRPETRSVARALHRYRTIREIQAPGTIDGGDVLVLGRNIYVGLSSRTNVEGIEQLGKLTANHGYRVHAVQVSGFLHLKSAVTQVAENMVLLNPEWISMKLFEGFDVIEVHPDEQHAANALMIGEAVVFPAHHPRTLRILQQRGLHVHTIEVGELAKAEAGVTCCSLLLTEFTNR
jgi:dimethylargininase